MPNRVLGTLVLWLALVPLAGGGATAQTSSILSAYRFDRPAWRTALPAAVREASGLVFDGQRLLVHGDENAVILALDPKTGAVQAPVPFSQNDPQLLGDFEAIDVHRGRIILMQSDGELLIGGRDERGAIPALVRHRTGLGSRCEFESMVVSQDGDDALLICKQMTRSRNRNDLDAYRISLRNAQAKPVLAFTISGQALRTTSGLNAFNPSDATYIGTTGHLLVVAGRQRSLVELDRRGIPVGGAKLARKLHPQPEGIVLMPDGTLLIADEAATGSGPRSAHLTAYRPERR